MAPARRYRPSPFASVQGRVNVTARPIDNPDEKLTRETGPAAVWPVGPADALTRHEAARIPATGAMAWLELAATGDVASSLVAARDGDDGSLALAVVQRGLAAPRPANAALAALTDPDPADAIPAWAAVEGLIALAIRIGRDAAREHLHAIIGPLITAPGDGDGGGLGAKAVRGSARARNGGTRSDDGSEGPARGSRKRRAARPRRAGTSEDVDRAPRRAGDGGPHRARAQLPHRMGRDRGPLDRAVRPRDADAQPLHAGRPRARRRDPGPRRPGRDVRAGLPRARARRVVQELRRARGEGVHTGSSHPVRGRPPGARAGRSRARGTRHDHRDPRHRLRAPGIGTERRDRHRRHPRHRLRRARGPRILLAADARLAREDPHRAGAALERAILPGLPDDELRQRQHTVAGWIETLEQVPGDDAKGRALVATLADRWMWTQPRVRVGDQAFAIALVRFAGTHLGTDADTERAGLPYAALLALGSAEAGGGSSVLCPDALGTRLEVDLAARSRCLDAKRRRAAMHELGVAIRALPVPHAERAERALRAVRPLVAEGTDADSAAAAGSLLTGAADGPHGWRVFEDDGSGTFNWRAWSPRETATS